MTVSEPPRRIPPARVAIQWISTVAVLWLVFGVLLPRLIDYEDVVEAIASLTWPEVLILLVGAALFSFSMSAIYTSVIPGLRFWPGWQTYEASGTMASVAPFGADLAVRYAMYRSFGVSAEVAGSGFILSSVFTIGIKLVMPVLALGLVAFSNAYETTTVTWVVLAVCLALVMAGAIALQRERLAHWLGGLVERWYNRLLAGKWRFKPMSGAAEKLVELRTSMIETLGSNWRTATVAVVAAQVASLTVLVLAFRFVGIDSTRITGFEIFVAYSVGLIASMAPLLPQGVGAVELVYVVILTGEAGDALSDQILAAAFVHRIFTWFLPILLGIVPLVMWRRRMAASGSPADDLFSEEDLGDVTNHRD